MAAVSISAYAQDLTVKGTVLSKTDDEPLIGATVLSSHKGTAGTATDIDGNFTLTVPAGSTLTFSYIGYESVSMKAAPDDHLPRRKLRPPR